MSTPDAARDLAYEIAEAAGYSRADVDALWVTDPAPPDVDEKTWQATETLFDLFGHDPTSGFLQLVRAMKEDSR